MTDEIQSAIKYRYYFISRGKNRSTATNQHGAYLPQLVHVLLNHLNLLYHYKKQSLLS